MKGIIISLLIATGFCQTIAAQDTVYINKKYEWVDNKADAVEYGVISHEGKNTLVAFYTLDGRAKGVGSYSVYKAKKRIKNGKSTYLYPNRKDSLVCIMAKNLLERQSISYYPNGQEHIISTYKRGMLNGQLIQYYENGALKRKEEYADSKSLGGHLYDIDGKELSYVPYLVLPEFKGGMDALINIIFQKVRIPLDAFEDKKSGKVAIRIMINKEGTVSNIEVVDSVSPSLDAEAVRVVTDIAKHYKWIPGSEDGVPKDNYCVIPIGFQIPV